jgi:AI-2 transport protein TqsA
MMEGASRNENRVSSEQVSLAVGSLMIIAAVALAVALIYMRAVMIPFVLAIFIMTAVAPVVDFQIVRWRVPASLAIAATLILVLFAMGIMGVALIVAVQTTVDVAREYSEQVVGLTNRLVARLNNYNVHIDEARIATELQSKLPGMISTAAGTISTLFSDGFLIILFVIFLFAGRDPHKRRVGAYADIELAIRRYITTKTVVSAITGLLVGLILWALGLRMAFLFGLMAFLLDFIPNVGSLVAIVLPVPIALAQFNNPWSVAAVVGLPAMVHLTIGYIVEPKLMGRGLELHPVVVLLALAFWGLLWGIIGMVLAVPIVAMLRIVLLRFRTTYPLGEMLAGRLTPSEPGIEVG